MSTPCFPKRAFKRQHSKCNCTDFLHRHKAQINSHLPPPLLSYMAENEEKERVQQTTAATTKMESKMRSQPKVTAPNVFWVCIDASPSYDRIQIHNNIHKWMYIYFYLRRSLILLRSWASTPNDVGADSDWSKCFISAISVSAVGIPITSTLYSWGNGRVKRKPWLERRRMALAAARSMSWALRNMSHPSSFMLQTPQTAILVMDTPTSCDGTPWYRGRTNTSKGAPTVAAKQDGSLYLITLCPDHWATWVIPLVWSSKPPEVKFWWMPSCDYGLDDQVCRQRLWMVATLTKAIQKSIRLALTMQL